MVGMLTYRRCAHTRRQRTSEDGAAVAVDHSHQAAASTAAWNDDDDAQRSHNLAIETLCNVRKATLGCMRDLHNERSSSPLRQTLLHIVLHIYSTEPWPPPSSMAAPSSPAIREAPSELLDKYCGHWWSRLRANHDQQRHQHQYNHHQMHTRDEEHAMQRIVSELVSHRIRQSIDRDGQPNLEAQRVQRLLRDFLHDREQLLQVLSQLAEARHLRFPFKRYHLRKSAVAMFESLLQHKMHIDDSPFSLLGIANKSSLFGAALLPIREHEASPPRFVTFVSQPEDYDEIDVITDYFTEEQRMSARRNNEPYSPLECWQRASYNRKFFAEIIEQQKPLDSYHLREAVYHHTKECTQFKASLTRAVIQLFGAKRMLDFSAGWGDRLIGAIGAGVERYLGVDPNTALRAGHDAIIEQLARVATPSTSSTAATATARFSVIYEPFQSARLPETELPFDLVFTSPPYFTFELYTTLEGQSTLDFPVFDDWLVHFLFVSLRKAWAHLADGGHMVIHLSDTRGATCCEPMNLFVQAYLDDAVYLGVVAALAGRDLRRPMWVWQKNAARAREPSHAARKTEAASCLSEAYPGAAQRLAQPQ